MNALTSTPTVGVPAKSIMEKASVEKVKTQPVYYPFWFGGSAASMAACVTHPLDLGMSATIPSPSF